MFVLTPIYIQCQQFPSELLRPYLLTRQHDMHEKNLPGNDTFTMLPQPNYKFALLSVLNSAPKRMCSDPSMSLRTIKIWNKLPMCLVCERKINVFLDVGAHFSNILIQQIQSKVNA